VNQHDWILQVVNSFYAKAKTDILIGYHFRVISDFDHHIPRIASFWDLQLLGKTNRSSSEPFDVLNIHLKMGIHKGELGRWLILFRKTLDEETLKHPEMADLKEKWSERLNVFEGIFSRFLGF
jgi:hemoglobin